MTIRVVVCDDEELLREALSRLVSVAPDLEVVATAADGQQAIDAVARYAPDVVLMDIRMPVLDGIDATRRIVQNRRGEHVPRVLMLTTYDLDSYVYAALQAGASGFLLKDAPSERLRDGIRIVASGHSILAPEATTRMIEALQPSMPSEDDKAVVAAIQSLTEREREVFELLAEGMGNQEIADRLRISRYTVKVHVSNVLSKLGLPDRVHAVLAWSRLRGRI
ncbi:two component transcriptional regulator, LuxR family [Streptoalloteichus tenebrarius]|uniref:Two component transcriptional regulator, LuxR family n=1 Tax=Streptoalloteichus tenebrarius (strain ATCC 17920 / DSM 40477 / JCM 4838 / CBS 697.72 / NBRC 16177 / NCIMB 11028 / NRRL B-12390 / A12253. 1 / ISP 5477) TaxID=1933 RepID=A0ABT1HU89_STRSD|nr:response regulator transcription factor [Streptoalloteichus tenebrarius]MCP2259057.1 two component transcriptional regulator, LuxR family [Streptoalloteichus tenebrarius]BFE99617.1 response regulator transcription factor [Streptoalloteichus tenebrarius]